MNVKLKGENKREMKNETKAEITHLHYFSGDNCQPLIGDANTSVQKQSYFGRTTYMVQCLNNKAFFGPYGKGGHFAFCKSGSYYINLNYVDVSIGLRTPDCVGEYKMYTWNPL